jgi:DNA-binding CsgD family transcriptional regulator
VGAADSLDHAQRALAIARELDEPALLARALTACGSTAAYSADDELARACFAEATELVRALGDRWRLSQILSWQAASLIVDPRALCAPAEEGRDLAEAIGDRFVARVCRWCLAVGQTFRGDLAGAATQLAELAAEARAAHDGVVEANSRSMLGLVLAYQGDPATARPTAAAAAEAAAELGGVPSGFAYIALAAAGLADGDVAAARDACEAAGAHASGLAAMGVTQRSISAHVALAEGDLTAARRRADEAVPAATGFRLMLALTVRARVAITAGEPDQAERDAHDALAVGGEIKAHLSVPDILDCLAVLAGDGGNDREATRLFGAAHAMRVRMGMVRFKVDDAGCEGAAAGLREALGEKDFDSAWAEGEALSTEEAIAYAQRGRGQRKRPNSGWASLTPTERDVVRLVSEGLGNNDIATRLFVSPRTVQSHLTHVYSKLGLTSRVQLAQEAARHE